MSPDDVKYEIITDDLIGRKRIVNKVGETKKNKWGVEYEIIGYVKGYPRLRQVRFFKSGYITIVSNYNIKDGSVSDYTQPSVCGIGVPGFKDASKHELYYRWANMIGRCYNEKHRGYKSYGAKGCYVEDYLLNFKNYIEFVEGLENFNLLKGNPEKYHIDKDMKCKSDKCYSRDTLSIITKERNIEIENSDKSIYIEAYDLNGNFVASFVSITIAEKMTGIHRGNIARTVRGESKTAGGYVWREKKE